MGQTILFSLMAPSDTARLFLLVLGLLVNASAVASTTEEFRIPALGEIAELGQLYDAKNGQFRPVNVFKTRELPSEAIRVLNVSKATVRTTTSSTFKNQLKLFNIKGNTAANILSGLVQPEGGAAFLRNTHTSLMDVCGILLFKYRTVQENLQIFNEELKALYTKDVLHHKEATHVLTGIKWGANVALTLQGKASSTENRQDLNSALENEIKIIGSAKAVSTESISNFTMYFTADIALPVLDSASHGQVKQILDQIPVKIQGTEGGKGAPIEFTFTPIGLIREHNQITEALSMLHQVDEWILQKFIDIYDDISSVDQQLSDLSSLVSSNTICLTSETQANMSQLLSDFETSKLKFTAEFNTELVNVRSGQLQPTALSNLVQAYNGNKFNSKNVRTELAQFGVALEKIKLYNVFNDGNPAIEYFGSNNDFTTRVQQNLENVIYVLFQSPQLTQNNPEAFKSNLNTFLTTLSKPFNKLFVVDCDFGHTECGKKNETTIKQIFQGQTTVQDVDFEMRKATLAEPLKIKAIGSFAQIGELFDFRKNKFTGRSILSSKKSKDSNLVTSTTPSSETLIVPSGRYHDKFKTINIDPEQQFSILAEVAQLTRTGLYFNPQEVNNEIASIVNIRRLSEHELKTNDPAFLSFLDINVALRPLATHFVSKIEYGFSTFYSIHDDGTITRNATQLQDYLNNLKAFISKFNADADTKVPRILPELPPNWKIKIFSDIQGIEEKPTVVKTNEELLIYLHATLVEQQSIQNHSQGQPIAYVLEPIQNLRAKGVLGKSVSFGLVLSNDENPEAFESILDDVKIARNQINHLSMERKENAGCITDHDAQVLKGIETNFEATLGSFIPQFKRVVKEIRSGKKGAEELTRLRQDFRNKTYFTGDGRYSELQNFTLFEQKLHLYKQVKGTTITYLGRENSSPYFSFVLDPNEKYFRYYLLYYKPEWVREKTDVWLRFSHVFFNLFANDAESSTSTRLYLIDCDFGHPKCEGMTQPAIHAYKNGKLTSANFLVTVEEDEKEWHNANNAMTSKLQGLVSIIANIGHELSTANKTCMANIAKVTDTIAAVDSKVTKNENNIVELRTGLDDVKKNFTQDQIKIRADHSCEEAKPAFIANATKSASFGCGGTIQLPSKGESIVLDFNLAATNGATQRCLWTLHATQNNKVVRFKVKLTLLCKQPTDILDDNTFTFTEWHSSGPTNKAITTNRISSSSQDSFLLSPYNSFRGFLSFNSKRINSEAGFVLRVDVLDTHLWSSWASSSATLKESFGSVPYSLPSSSPNWSSIVINPQPAAKMTLTVDVDSSGQSNPCEYWDSVDVLEFGMDGIPNTLGRLCGRQSAISYETENPVAALFYWSPGRSGRGVKLSWK